MDWYKEFFFFNFRWPLTTVQFIVDTFCVPVLCITVIKRNHGGSRFKFTNPPQESARLAKKLRFFPNFLDGIWVSTLFPEKYDDAV